MVIAVGSVEPKPILAPAAILAVTQAAPEAPVTAVPEVAAVPVVYVCRTTRIPRIVWLLAAEYVSVMKPRQFNVCVLFVYV